MTASKQSVLIVDDDRDLRETLADGLEAAGYTVIQSENVYHLMRELPSMHISVAILDLVLGGPSGGALVGYIKMHPHLRHIKVIMMSGFEHAKATARLWGADLFIQKPVTIAKLIEALEVVITSVSEIQP
jgi:DNA-binding response OmpR family regulator